MAGMDDVSGFWVKHYWCEHMQQTYEENGIRDQMVSCNMCMFSYILNDLVATRVRITYHSDLESESESDHEKTRS